MRNVIRYTLAIVAQVLIARVTAYLVVLFIGNWQDIRWHVGSAICRLGRWIDVEK